MYGIPYREDSVVNKSRRFFMSSMLGAGVILPTTGSLLNFNIIDHLRYTWKSLELKEITSSYPTRNPAITVRSEDGSTILTDTIKNKDLLKLNAVASDIWELCCGENNVDDMVKKITSHFDVEADACRRDIILALMSFKRKGLILLS
jgi:hypothetical protein